MTRKVLKGIIVSTKTPKKLVVKVEFLKMHSKLKKRFRATKRYQAHYEDGQFQTGEKVLIEETRPLSKTKKWRVVSKP